MKCYAKLYCKKKNINKDGKTLIYLVIRIGIKEKLLSTGKYIDPGLFNNSGYGGIIEKRNHGKLNTYLENEKNKVNDLILDLQYKNEVITFDKIIHKYCNTSSAENFLEFAYKELELLKPKLAKKTYLDYYYSLKNLEEFNAELTFDDLSYRFLTRFEVWLKAVKHRNQNSRVRNFTAIRKFLNLAINYGLTKNYPFRQFKFSGKRVEREHLTEIELTKLQELFDSKTLSEKLQKTLGNFLFTCYTGIAADDMKHKERLKIDGKTVTFNRGKTGEFVMVPLSNKAKALVPFIQEENLKQKTHRIHQDLTEIMELASIDKHITYHCGRHTFAVISLIKGISLSVVSNVLGHTATKTTEIYAKVVDQLLNTEMAKWDD